MHRLKLINIGDNLGSTNFEDITAILEILPLPIGVAKQVIAGEKVTDFQLTWMNSEFRTEKGLPYEIGDNLSDVLPELFQAGWVEQLGTIRTQTSGISRFVDVQVSGKKQIARVHLVWIQELLVFTVELLSHQGHDRDDAIRAASIVTQIMPKLPIAYSVRGDGESWLRFPTPSFLENLGITKGDYLTADFLELVHQVDRHRFGEWLATPNDKKVMPFTFRMGNGRGDYLWVELWSAKLPEESEHPNSSSNDVVILRDVDLSVRLQESNKELSEAVQDQLELMTKALNASQDGFAIWKAVRHENNSIIRFDLVYINKAGAAATGRAATDLIGRSLSEVVGEDESKGLFELFSTALNNNQEQKAVVPLNSPAGWVGAYENTVVPFATDQVLATFRDVGEEQREHQRLVWLTQHDYLTGMPNRSMLESYLEKVVESAKLGESKIAFIFIDIDYFKNVNDTYGHDIGDALLVNFVKRVRHSLPESALVARISGDEFAIVLNDLKDEQNLRDLVDEVFSAMKRPFNHNTPDLQITCSAGCVLTDGSEEPAELIRLADKAMYQAKHEGRNRYLVNLRLSKEATSKE